jgi:integrase
MTTNPPHPLIKAVDNELVLRGMAYSTRKSYGQHLRNHFDWLARTRLTPEQATRERIRAYLVEKASSGLVSAGYCRQARGIDTAVRDSAEAAGQVHDLPRMKRPKQLPIVLSREEVARLLKVVYNLKRKIAANTGKCRDTRKFCCGEYEFCDTRDHRHGGLGVGIGSITLLITWYLLSRQWYGYQAIAFYRMREIETDLGLWGWFPNP